MKTTQLTQSIALPIVLNVTLLSRTSRAYWLSLARRLAGHVGVIDPYRYDLRDLRSRFPHLRGLTCYRASTGGRWGKSAQRVTL